jgi:hypothetical protein
VVGYSLITKTTVARNEPGATPGNPPRTSKFEEDAVMTLIETLSLLVSGTLVGNEFAVAVFFHPVLCSVSEDAHARVVKPLALRLGRAMPVWYAASLVLVILQLLTIGRADRLAWSLCLAAAIIFAAIIVLTILLAVPINNKIAALDPDHLPPGWLGLRRRWDLYHQIRVGLLFVALILLILSALLHGGH